MAQVAMAAYSIYQGKKAGDAAKEDAARRDAAMAESKALGIEERDYYRKKFGPVNQMLIDYAMGNKPSPYLAQAKGKIEAGYTGAKQKLDEISASKGLGMTGIGAGQKIGLGMERAKQLADLNLKDSAQRYGVAQSLSNMETMATKGAQMAQGATMQSGAYANQDMISSSKYASEMMDKGAQGLADWAQGGGMEKSFGQISGLFSQQQGAVEDSGRKAIGTNTGSGDID